MLDVSRREIKYEVGLCLAAVLRQRLAAVLAEDPHNGGSGYLGRSVYFDTPDALDYYQKLDGLDNRKKLRLRIYGFGDAPAKLELKQKQGAFQRKRSLSLSRRQAEQLLAGNQSCLNDFGEFGQALARRMALGAYRPGCLVEYDRIAFFSPTNDTRVTLDCRLRASESCFRLYDPAVPLTPVGSPAAVTLEVKYNRFLLSFVKDAVSVEGMLNVSASKYCRGRQFGIGGE